MGKDRKTLADARKWKMLVVDIDTGKTRIAERNMTTREVAIMLDKWPAEDQNAPAIFWPEWAPELTTHVPSTEASCAEPSVSSRVPILHA